MRSPSRITDATCTGLISGNTATLVGQTLTIPASSIRDRAVIECTFTNTKLPTVTVKKVTQGYVGTSSFTGTNGLPATPTNIVTTAMNTAATTATPGAGLNALVLPIVPATDTVITEALPGAGYALTAISCSGLGAGGTANNNLTAGTVTLNPAAISAGSDVVCTFTNAKLPTLTISKISTGGVDTFGFTGNNGWLSQNITTLTQGVAATGSTQTLSAASTPTTITETMPAGYALNSVTCSGLNGGNVTLNLAAGTATLDALATAPGNVLTCTFNNGKMPALSFSKTVDVVFDPVNLGVNPKNIPGAVVEYTLGLVNSGSGMIDSNSTVITDKVPANTVLYVGNDPVWLAPFQFVDGTVASGLTCGFASLSDASDCMDFSNDNGGTFAYVPSPAADGFDSNVTNIRFKPAGSMNANSGSGSPSFKLKFKVKIK